MTAAASMPPATTTSDPTPDPTNAAPLEAGDVVVLQPVGEPTVGPDGIATAAAAPLPKPTLTPTEAVQAADEVKEGLRERSQTVGDLVDTLDAWALKIGNFRVSIWDTLVVVGVIALVIAFAWLLSRVVSSLLRRVTKLDDTQHLLAEKLTTMAIWGLAFFVGIDLLGIDLTALAVFSGAFGLAIGFGLQKTFGNLIAGIILLMDKSIKPGDVIAVADQAGNSTFGQIRKIGIRAVSITTRDQKEYLIPNENLMVNQVENWSYSSRNVRMQVPVGVSYNCDIKLAEKLMLQAAKECRRVLKTPPPTCWLDEYGDSSVNFIIHCWITDPEEGIGNVKSEVLKKLWDLFAQEGVEIPFPQRDINVRTSAQMDQLVAAIAQRVEKD
ncbi:MAG: mechanosensitive ion channel domain-containing protein [Parerythrobacter sp.]